MKLRIFFMHHTSNTVYIHIHGKERTFCQRDAVECVENKLVYGNNATMTLSWKVVPQGNNYLSKHIYFRSISHSSLAYLYLACSRLSDSREGTRVMGTRTVSSHLFIYLFIYLFLRLRFLNSADPIISESGTG